MRELTINEELRALLPPLTEEECQLLQEDIAAAGCQHPITTWNGMVVDGHNRYKICRSLNIPFEIKERQFDSLDHAKCWILTHQMGRRNLNAFQRAELMLKLKPVFEAEARENQGTRTDLSQNLGKSSPLKPIDTLKAIGRAADVSHETIRKVERIMEKADDATLNELRAGNTSIDREFKRLKSKSGEKKNPKSYGLDTSLYDAKAPLSKFSNPEDLALQLCHLFPARYPLRLIKCIAEKLIITKPQEKKSIKQIISVLENRLKQKLPQDQ